MVDTILFTVPDFSIWLKMVIAAILVSSVNQLSLLHFMLVERQQFLEFSGYVKQVTRYTVTLYFGAQRDWGRGESLKE